MKVTPDALRSIPRSSATSATLRALCDKEAQQAVKGALVALALTVLAVAPARADPPPNYAAVFAGTTVAYRPPGGPFDGYQHDLTGLVGYGRYVSRTIALELDLGPTWVRGDYASFALVPGVVWAFSPHVYAAARFIVPVDPELNLALFPGVGLIHTFGDRISPLVEVNALSYVGRGHPDFGVAITVGVLVSF
jgi:hypothetical protein